MARHNRNGPAAEPAHTEAPPRHAPPVAAGYVYFIQPDVGGPVKIGWALDPERRLREIQTGNPNRLVIRARFPGSLTDEARLHRRFASQRLAGEWFTPSAEMEQVAGAKLPKKAHVRSPAKPQRVRVLLCDTCRTREAISIDLRPYATWGCDAHLICAACEDEGYCIEISEWNDPTENLDWRNHLIDTKNDGHGIISKIEERLSRKDWVER